jgi:hypothetical protein
MSLLEEATEILRDIPDRAFDVHVWRDDGYVFGTMDGADRVRIVMAVLNARRLPKPTNVEQ